ncbi:MAG: hypothetical protein HC849_02525 [Oscillatoriales cyanobacterium RU_3_3]|nr:hypothetical protein [Oscillatoriales cyanobacterium RU_3_3]
MDFRLRDWENYQLPTVNCQLSTVNYQLSTIYPFFPNLLSCKELPIP